MSISYIIATYSGKEHVSNGDLSENVLDCQIRQLECLLRNKEKEKIPNHINTLCIVSPHVDRKNEYENYYKFEEWKELLEPFDIEIVRVQYVGDNKHHSYDQWIQGWLACSSDYYLLCED